MPSPASEHRLNCRIDLGAIVFDGDRDMRAALLGDATFREVVAEAEANLVVASARRELLLQSLRLTPKIAPDFFGALDRVVTRLGLEAEIEAYCLSEPVLNAFVTPPENGRVLLGVSSATLERLDPSELAFVLGHELGHALLDHFSLTPEALASDERLAPAQLARYYAWMRYAELSADRVGLLCCEDADAAVRAFFKLTSGLSEPRFLGNVRESANQWAEISGEAMESAEADWFSTHPYSPLRLKALDVFARSETYHALLGKAGGELTEADLEREVHAIMKLMDPSFLDDQSDGSSEVRDFLALAGVAVATADGTVVDAERELVVGLVGEEGRLSDGVLIEELGDEEFERRLLAIAEKLCLKLSLVRRQKILEDLVAIALADRDLADEELEVLGTAAIWLGVDPGFVQEAIARFGSALD
ncbi:MAG: M48 family metallopeptidase [Polyangiaceae bacterium]